MKRWTRRHGWGLLAILLCVLVWLDTCLVRQEPRTAYVPSNADVILFSSDFPALCSSLARTDAAGALNSALQMPLHRLMVSVRQETGIRPTPWRWRLWLGPQLVVAHTESGWGGCVRPGVLMRAVTYLQRTPKDGLFHWGSLTYGWRDGYLVFSPSREYVASSLADPPRALEIPHPSTALQATFRQQDGEGVLQLQPDSDFTFSGWIRPARGLLPPHPDHNTSLALVETWPECPLFSVTGVHWEDVRFISSLRFGLVHFFDPYKASAWFHAERFLAAHWGMARLPKGWNQSSHEFALALFDMSLDGILPVPDMALVMRQEMGNAPNPLLPLAQSGSVIPYEWEGKRGELIPFLGDRWTLCMAHDDKDWIATSNQQRMGAVLKGRHAGTSVQADWMVQLNWNRLGDCTERILRTAISEELLWYTDARDFDREWMPYVDGIKQLGFMEVRGIRDGEQIQVDGMLTHNAKEVH